MTVVLIIAAIWIIGTIIILYSQFKDAWKGDPSGGLLTLVLGPIIILIALFWPISLPWIAYDQWKRKMMNKKKDK